MSGSGHVQDMNNRIRQNRAQRPSKRPKFKEHNRDTFHSSSRDNQKNLKFKTVSEEKLIEIKKQIRQRAKKELKKERIVLGLLVIIVLLTAILFYWWV